MVNDFLRIINSNQTKLFLDKAISILYHKDYPFCTYLGINYTNEKLINVKFYITGFKKIDFERIESIFPYSEQIQSYYNRYKESFIFDYKNMGLSFALKQDLQGNLKHGFCMRVKDKMNPNLTGFDLVTENHDVDDYFAIESSFQNLYSKYYYVITNRNNINQLTAKFDFPVDPMKILLFEYASFGENKKLLAALKNTSDVEDYLQSSNSKFIKLHEFIKSEFNFVPASPGLYLDSNVKSIYYFDQGEPVYFRDSFALLTILEKLKKGIIS